MKNILSNIHTIAVMAFSALVFHPSPIVSHPSSTVSNPSSTVPHPSSTVSNPSSNNPSSLISPPSSTELKALQSRIDSVSAAGGGRVELEQREYVLNGSLRLKSGVELHVPQGAVLRFSGEPDDFLPVVPTRWEGTELMGRSAMIYTNGQHDVSITGGGIIDACGGKMARWGMAPEQLEREAGGGKDSAAWQEITHGTHGETIEMPDVRRLREMGSPSEGEPRPVSERVFGKGTFLRPCAIEFYDCKNVRLEGFTLKNSPFWCIHPVYCDSVTVRGVTIDSHYPNNDGCDPESSSNVLIEDCLFRTGDDAVAIKSGRDADGWRVGRPSENITIRNCRFYSECNGLCIGSEMSGGVRNVRMENVEIGKVKNALLFKSNLDRGGYIRDVVVKNITIEGVHGAVLRFETNYFGYRGGNSPAQYENFHIAGVKAGKAEGYGIYYDGNEQCPIRNVTVEDFHVESATHPYYLYHTQNCTFTGCTVGGVAVPEHPEESKERQSCDVW